MTGIAPAPAVLLIADDNADDRDFIRLGLKSRAHNVHVEEVSDGAQCLEYLRKQGRFVGAPTADLLLLDINMPQLDGFQVMESIIADRELREMPVIVLTTSDRPEDLHRMYSLRCNAYVKKSLDFKKFQRELDLLVQFWLTVVTLPTRGVRALK